MIRLILLSSLLLISLRAQTPLFAQRVQRVIQTYAHPNITGPLGYANIGCKSCWPSRPAICSGCSPSPPLLIWTRGS
jgi:hypothetical protein